MSLERFKERLNISLDEVKGFIQVELDDVSEDTFIGMMIESAIEDSYNFMGNDFLEPNDLDYQDIMGTERNPWNDRRSSKVLLENQVELSIPIGVRLAIFELVNVDFDTYKSDPTIKSEKVGGVTISFSSAKEAKNEIMKNRLSRYSMIFNF